MDFYIINKDGVIIYSSFITAIGIDFKEIPEFYERLNKLRLNNKIEISKLTSELRTNKLRKWGYIPTNDHNYILEVGISSEEIEKYIRKIDYGKMEKNLRLNNPYVKSLDVYDMHHVNLKTYTKTFDPEETRIIDKVLASKQNYKEKYKKELAETEYIFINTSSNILDDSLKVVRLNYDYSEIDEKIHRTAMNMFFTLGAYIIAALTMIFFITTSLISAPIKDLTRHVKKISDKNLCEYTEVYGNNEIGQLAISFNEMSLKLHSTLALKENLENIIDSAGELFIILDNKFRIKHINTHGLKFLGYNLEYLKGRALG